MATSSRIFIRCAIAASFLLLCTSMALAGGGPRDHTGGFFLRLSVGGGAASTSIGSGSNELKLDGPSADLNFAIGGMVSRNLALHGTIWGWMISDPDVEIGGLTGTAQGDLDLSAIGAGLTYYFMPVNIYLSGSLGAGKLSVDGGGFEGSSDAGFVADLTLGKEWWVGNNWGLGVALGLGIHSIPDGGVSESWGGGSAAVRFTATMN